MEGAGRHHIMWGLQMREAFKIKTDIQLLVNTMYDYNF